jgi:hypothetical protein
MRRAIRLGVLALVVALVGVAAFGSPAFAHRRRRRPKPPPSTAPVQIGDTAALSADHRTADVVLTLRCPTGATAVPIKVFVRQNGVSGSGSGTGYTCNDHPQRLVVRTSSAGFRKGSAVASLSVSWHGSTSTKTNNSTSNVTANASRVIQLV